MRSVAAAAVVAAGMLFPAASAPAVQVQLRVEGAAGTVFEGPVNTGARTLDGGDGTGAHACDRPSALGAVADSAERAGFIWAGRWNPDFREFFVDRIGADASDAAGGRYWSVLVNWRYARGGCGARVADGDQVLWVYDDANHPQILRVTGPARVAIGEPFSVEVRDGWVRADTGADGGPVAGVRIGDQTTGADGRATLRFSTSGLRRLKAVGPDAIRSNALDVCVGDLACAGALVAPAAPGAPGAVRLSIAKIHDGDRFARGAGPRLLRGSAADGAVSLALRTSTGRLVAGRTVQTRAGRWSARIKPLPPGRYRLAARQQGSTSAVSFTLARGPRTVASARRVAAAYLVRAAGRGGRFGSAPRARPSSLFTGWAAIGLASAPADPATRRVLGAARHALRAKRPRSIGDLERSVLALRGSRARADRVAVARWRSALARRGRADGSFAGEINLTAYGALALEGGSRGQRARARRARTWVARRLAGDGPSRLDTDSLGAALWALARRKRAPAARATRSLRAAQSPDGGFPTRAGEPSNAQSTALAVVGLSAAGRHPERLRTEDGISPFDYLRARTTGRGAVAYARGSHRTPVWVTAQALRALAER